MKLSKFLAAHIADRDDYCAKGVCDHKEYEAMLEVIGADIAEGIVKYQEYLKGLNTARYSVAIHELQLVEALAKMEFEHKPICEIKVDPVCLMHGKKASEHTCLYCCLCFKDLNPDECNVTADGKKEDVCKPCAKREAEQIALIENAEVAECLGTMPNCPNWFLISLSIITLIVLCLKIWGKI